MTLYAPQVRQIQPAFEYDRNKNKGTVKIYCSFSAFDENVSNKKIRCTIVDPNQSTLDGNNSMIINASKYIDTEFVSGEDYIEINLLNSDVFKPFTLNQFYHVQLRTVAGGTISEPSTISLIRPIPPQSVTFDPIDTSLLGLSTEIQVSGRITSEKIVSYKISLLNSSNAIQYTSPIIYNDLGNKFSTLINYNFEAGQVYKFKIDYKTAYDFESEGESDIFNASAATIGLWQLDTAPSAVNNDEIGAIEITVPQNASFKNTGIYSIFRSDSKNNFTYWKRIFAINIEEYKTQLYRDFDVENNVAYKYRLVYEANGEKVKYDLNEPILCEFEHIFIADRKGQYAVKYNPNITGYKKVVQESITNALGGKYPIIRKNGETGYRQFSLSGTIYADYPSLEDNRDSTGKSMKDWFKVETPFVYGEAAIPTAKAYEYCIQESMSQTKKNEIYNQYFRALIIDFLEDSGFKIFRSPTEGNMLVYLSNISFTPNKSLSREVYDFTATATECGELNQETLERYGLNIVPKLHKLIAKGSVVNSSLEVAQTEISGHSLYLYLEEV